LKLARDQQQDRGEVLREIRTACQFLVDVGLDYVTLSRPRPLFRAAKRSASAWPANRQRPHSVLYVLDEPTSACTRSDNRRQPQALNKLTRPGQYLGPVEHDRKSSLPPTICLDFGPGAGDLGGEITAQGTPGQVRRAKSSLTGQYLSGKKAIPYQRIDASLVERGAEGRPCSAPRSTPLPSKAPAKIT